jgi:hypothetical protein
MESQFWTTKNSRKLKITNIRDDHLINIHKMLLRKDLHIYEINYEMRRRGFLPISPVIELWEIERFQNSYDDQL